MIDWTKPIQTRDGKPARFMGKLETHAPFRFIVAVQLAPPDERLTFCDAAGDTYFRSELQIVNRPEPKRTGKFFVNVYQGYSAVGHATREFADFNAGSERMACIEVNWVEGQGI